MSHLWTRGESNPFLIYAIDSYYRYTTGPFIQLSEIDYKSYQPKTLDLIVWIYRDNQHAIPLYTRAYGFSHRSRVYSRFVK